MFQWNTAVSFAGIRSAFGVMTVSSIAHSGFVHPVVMRMNARLRRTHDPASSNSLDARDGRHRRGHHRRHAVLATSLCPLRPVPTPGATLTRSQSASTPPNSSSPPRSTPPKRRTMARATRGGLATEAEGLHRRERSRHRSRVVDGHGGLVPASLSEFRVDRPFIFIIRERQSGATLFMGKMLRIP